MTSAVLCRGSVVTVASPGVYSGKPWPAVVVQADPWLQAHPSVTLCPPTGVAPGLPHDLVFVVSCIGWSAFPASEAPFFLH